MKLNAVLIMILLMFSKIPFTKENELIEINKQKELRNLEEATYGKVTLHFDTTGEKKLINVIYTSKDKFSFYIKNGDVLTAIDSEITESSLTTSSEKDSKESNFKIINVLYTLNNVEDEIIIEFKEKPTSLEGLFSKSDADKIILENLQTQNVESMEFMFYYCQSLTQLDVSKWDVLSITYMNNMFSGCFALTQLDVSKWDTSKVTYMNNMFSDCFALTELDISKWDTSKVTNMEFMFFRCFKLTN